MKGHVDDHVLHVHVYIVPTMLAELLYPLQDGNTPLHLACKGGHTICVEYLLSTPGIDVNIKDKVSFAVCNDQVKMICMMLNTILYMYACRGFHNWNLSGRSRLDAAYANIPGRRVYKPDR